MFNFYFQSCEDLINLPNSHIQCSESGEIICEQGWTGDLCNVPICHSKCHKTNGYCTKPGECRCKPGRFYYLL